MITEVPFSSTLQKKIDSLKGRRTPISLNSLKFSSPFLLAPLSGITSVPFRLLMQDLGAGGTVSELVSAHGIKYSSERTLKMLTIDEREKNVGLQIFGEETQIMALAAQKAETFRPDFIDINMGCPVRKVVTKGGGAALLQNPDKLEIFFKTIRDAIKIPLTIKIRTGWDTPNAEEVLSIAAKCDIEMVAIHGRTRTQQYRGLADWDYLEELGQKSPMPLIGNGDLHTAELTKSRWQKTSLPALMLGRGPLRNPFIFLEIEKDNPVDFTGEDYLEVIARLCAYTSSHFQNERILLTQMKKFIVWFTQGLPSASTFRGKAFSVTELKDLLNLSEDYFLSLSNCRKHLPQDRPFMAGGHG